MKNLIIIFIGLSLFLLGCATATDIRYDVKNGDTISRQFCNSNTTMENVLEEYVENKGRFRDQYISATMTNLTNNYKVYVDEEGSWNYEGFLSGINNSYNRVDFRFLIMSSENCEVISVHPKNVYRSKGPFDYHFTVDYEPEKITSLWWRLYQN